MAKEMNSLSRAMLPFMATLLIPAGITLAAEERLNGASKDQGQQPWIVNIEELTMNNQNFRSALWTGKHMQMTVMAIPPGGEIGLEKHDLNDQFIRVESGSARVLMGPTEDRMTLDQTVSDDWAILIPAGSWHNIINIGDGPLKVYVLYGPPEHPAGTLHRTPSESQADHGH